MEAKPNSQAGKIADILEVYDRAITPASAQFIFEFLNVDEFPRDFIMTHPTVSAVVSYAVTMEIELFWNEKVGQIVYLENCYYPETYE